MWNTPHLPVRTESPSRQYDCLETTLLVLESGLTVLVYHQHATCLNG